jgi:cation transport ATPase
MTGESLPVSVGVGGLVRSGAVVQNGFIEGKCITIIDTIIHHILTNYTNDAYIFYDIYMAPPL